jgi:hypothetical protein
MSHRIAVVNNLDQAQEQRPSHRPLRVGERVVQPLRRGRYRAPHSARVAVPRDGQHPALAPRPCLRQGVGQQGQGTRLVHHVPNQQVDQPRLQAQPGLRRWSLDRLSQLRLGHRPQEVEAVLHHAA